MRILQCNQKRRNHEKNVNGEWYVIWNLKQKTIKKWII